MRAFSTSGTKRASACGSGRPQVESCDRQERAERPDRKHGQHDLPSARFFGVEPRAPVHQQHDERHKADPADRFDAVEPEAVIHTADGAAVQRMKRISQHRREHVDAARRAAPEIRLAHVPARHREPERLRDERQARHGETSPTVIVSACDAAPEHLGRRTLEAHPDAPLRQQPRSGKQPQRTAAGSARCAPKSSTPAMSNDVAAGHRNDGDEEDIERHQRHDDQPRREEPLRLRRAAREPARMACHDASV